MVVSVEIKWLGALAAASCVVLVASTGCVGTDDSPPAASGGSPATSGGSSSTSSGGSTSAAQGGSTGAPLTCATPVKPLAPVIIDFSHVDPTSMMLDGNFGDYSPGTLAGGTFVYPEVAGLVASFADLDWHITGRVANYSGFGFWLSSNPPPPLLDASDYKGLSFKLSGDAGAGGTVMLWLSIAPNLVPSTDATKPDCGLCTAGASGCKNFEVSIPVSATAGTVVTVPWADFKGGAPVAAVDPTQITGFGFYVPWTQGTDFDVDLVVDDFGFIP